MRKIFLLFIFILIIISIKNESLAAASLSLSPSTGGAALGQTFNVQILLDTGGASTTGVDMVLTYNPSILEITAFNPGSLFGASQQNPTIDNNTGKITYSASVTNAIYSYTTSGSPGVFATLTFKGKSAGTSQVSFTCSPGTTQSDTNVWSSNQDIISCSAVTGGNYTITATAGSSGSSNTGYTPTPTRVINSSGSGSSSDGDGSNTGEKTLPESGVMEWTLLLFAMGIFFILGGFKLLFSQNTNSVSLNTTPDTPSTLNKT